MSEVYIRSQNKEKLYRLGGNYACVEYGEYEDVKKKRALTLSKAVKAGCKVIALERTDTVAGMTTDDIAALKGVLKQYE